MVSTALRCTAISTLLLGTLGCAGLSPRTVHVEGPVTATLGPEHVALARNVDRAALDALVALPEPLRQRRLIEILKSNYSEQIGLLFTYVGRLRPELLAVAGTTDPSIEAAQRDTARFLLALWGDPADIDLPRGESLDVADAPAGIAGAGPEEACEAYVVPHFTKEEVKPPYTLHRCGQPMLDPDGTRALVEFTVRYAHWAYWELLVVVREGERWRLRSVVHWGIT